MKIKELFPLRVYPFTLNIGDYRLADKIACLYPFYTKRENFWDDS